MYDAKVIDDFRKAVEKEVNALYDKKQLELISLIKTQLEDGDELSIGMGSVALMPDNKVNPFTDAVRKCILARTGTGSFYLENIKK